MGCNLCWLLLFFTAAFCLATAVATGRRYGEEGENDSVFLMTEKREIVKTEAGEMKVLMRRKQGGEEYEKETIQIGFITMEPHSLFLPHYIDASLILFVRIGEVKVGCIYKDELVENMLKSGDIYTISAGSTFYLINSAEGQRLDVICCIHSADREIFHNFQSFYIGGGSNPISVLAGFNPRTLSAAFNVSVGELKDILTKQGSGAIIFTKRLEPERESELLSISTKGKEGRQDQGWWARKMLDLFWSKEENEAKKEAYNIYDKEPDFKNKYGWSTALKYTDYAPLKTSQIGIFLVNLTAGSMMAPHINPKATEYGIVIGGKGRLEVVFPNGTGAEAAVEEGDVFFIPKYFPFAQIASRTGPMQILGFTTSSGQNHPQFLAGKSSLLTTLQSPELAAAFGISEKRFRHIAAAQGQSIIVPSEFAAAAMEDLAGKVAGAVFM